MAKPLQELDDSFPTQTSAVAFGEYIQGRFLADYAVTRLVTHSGHATEWWRLAIPTRWIARASDLRDAWRAALNLVGKSEASL